MRLVVGASTAAAAATTTRVLSTRLGLSPLSSSSSSSSNTRAMSAAQQEPPAEASGGAAGSALPTPAAAVDFLTLLTNLKTTKRTGWVRSGVAAPESVADHSYRMAMMALLAGGAPGVDASRAVRVALVHDAAEALVGDITPHCGVSDADKHALEAAAVRRMQEMLGLGTDAAREVAALWHEYEDQQTPEAALVKDFDKLEMVLQATEYEAAQPGLDLQPFFDSTRGAFRTAIGKAWADEVVARRQRQRRQQQGQEGLQQQGEQQQQAGSSAAAAVEHAAG